jgi:glucose-6-phosphate isomerase
MQKTNFYMKFALQDGESRGALFSKDELSTVSSEVASAASLIEQLRGKPEKNGSTQSEESRQLAFLELPYAYEPEYGTTIFGDELQLAMEKIQEASAHIRQSNSQFLHLGIGGSALGAIMLLNALETNAKNDPNGSTQIHVPDNVDPDWIAAILRGIDMSKVYVNVISKSGGTVETIATFSILWEKMIRESGLPTQELQKRVFITTNPEGGALKQIQESEKFNFLPLPDSIHGRFSVLSPMGLFTAAIGGINIKSLLAGARLADQHTANSPFWENPAQQLAALHFLGLRKKGLSVLVLLPYSNGMRTVADWYSQLVAESLGKNGQGMTPVKALGVTDQHSQLQLYNDGPKDKLVVFFSVEEFAETLTIPKIPSTSAYEYLEGNTLNALLRAELQATEVSLHLHGVPSCRFELPKLNAFNLGYLITILEKTVCILGRLLNVNAFDQPGVEESKEYARAMLRKSGEKYALLRETVAKYYK